jgi:hypothetical protein
MNTFTNHIQEDTTALALTLTFEENVEALRCAQKIKRHLCRQVAKGNLKYQRNIEIIDQVIEGHRARIHQLGGSLGILKAS